MPDYVGLTADYFGKIQMLGIEADGYVLSDGTPCLSERGTAYLLGFSTPSVLERVYSNLWPKELIAFISEGFECTQTVVKVIANCPHKGSNIRVCDARTINTIARAYSRAYLKGKLRKNQIHIGLHCATLRDAMADIALEQMIYEACGYESQKNLPQRIEQSYIDAVDILQELGFACALPNFIATKQDITNFLKIPESTLNNFLRKHQDEIHPTALDIEAIRSIGSKANRMNGYHLDDVAKIVFGMDTEIGIELKKRMFGEVGALANPYTKDEIQWRKVLADVFKGFDMRYNYPICGGKYKVDFYIAKMSLILECNGISHKYYNRQEEEKREKAITKRYALVRFHPEISLETLFNGILQAKVGTVVRLYDLENICR